MIDRFGGAGLGCHPANLLEAFANQIAFLQLDGEEDVGKGGDEAQGGVE
jgi:hypothetical protein